MRAEAFVPGHISCVFRPYKGPTLNETGSTGFGIRLSLGCHASVSARDDGVLRICINGKESEASVTRSAIERLAPGRGFDVDLRHDLPLEQGFGASASGTYAAALCVCSLLGLDSKMASEATHAAECTLGGGLGDLLAIETRSGVPIRTYPGPLLIRGETEDSGLSFDKLTLIVFDEPLKTASVLTDDTVMERVREAGDEALRSFSADRTKEGLFRVSNVFSESIGLESEDIKKGLDLLRGKGYHAGMCMLGNSIYTDAPENYVIESFPGARVFSCSSWDAEITVKSFE
jgi:pantoate kinase